MKTLNKKLSPAFIPLSPIRIAVVYFIISALWIFFSDKLVLALTGNNVELFFQFQEFKGFIFIIITSVILFFLLSKYLRQLNKLNDSLVRSEMRYRSFFREALSANLVFLPDGKIIEANSAFIKIFEIRDVRSIEDLNLRDYFSDPAVFDECIFHVKNNSKLKNKDLEFISAAGKKIYTVVNIFGVFEGDILLRLKAQLIDETERTLAEKSLKETSQSLSSLIHNSPLGIFALDLNWKVILVWNKSAEKIYGWKTVEVMGKPLPTIPKDKNDEKLKIQNAILNGSNIIGLKSQRKSKDGKLIDVSLSYSSLLDNNGSIYGIFVFTEDITEKIISENQLKISRERLRALTAKLQSYREEERTHIAREIHDELGGSLTGLKMDLSWLNLKLNKFPEVLNDISISERIKMMNNILTSTVKTIRKISTELRPGILDDLGLSAALEWYCQDFAARTGIHSAFESSTRDLKINSDISTSMFRIFQESITNIIKHASAKNVFVKLELDGSNISLTIKDDGIGLKAADLMKKDSFGILGMNERAFILGGEVKAFGDASNGTTIKATVPMKN